MGALPDLLPLPVEPGFYLCDGEFVWERRPDGTSQYYRRTGPNPLPRFTTVVPLVEAKPPVEKQLAEPSPVEARPDEWDDAVAAYERASVLYPEVRHQRELFQYGARWMRSYLLEDGRLR